MEAQGILAEVLLEVAGIQALPQRALGRCAHNARRARLGSSQILVLQDVQSRRGRDYQRLLLLQLLTCSDGQERGAWPNFSPRMDELF